MKTMIQLSRWLAANASLFIIAIAVVTFFVPELFVWVRGTTQTVILGIIMLTMGLTLTTDDFKILARRPLDILIGACAQFLIMPCVAYLLVHVFSLEPALALGILLVGCCPGGVSSNIMSYLCHGDVAFSVGMTCASTLLAPVMTPLLMELTAGEIIEIDAIGMFLNILIVTIIPVGIGCFLNYTYSKNQHFPTIQSLMPPLSSATTHWAISLAIQLGVYLVFQKQRNAPSPSRLACKMRVLQQFLPAISLQPSPLQYCPVPSRALGIVLVVPFWLAFSFA